MSCFSVLLIIDGKAHNAGLFYGAKTIPLLSLQNSKPEFTIKTLNNAGHYLIESPGREQLESYFVEFLERYL